MSRQFIADPLAAPERLDVFLAKALGLTRSRAQKLWPSANVRVNQHLARPSYLVQSQDVIEIDSTSESAAPPPSRTAPNLPIVYEDADILVIDKPAGLIVHPGGPQSDQAKAESTVIDFIRPRTTDRDPERPGIVHRLDRDTSGLLVLAKTEAAKTAMQNQFRTRVVHKTYRALVVGSLKPPAAAIELPLDRDPAHPLQRAVTPTGRPATTRYRTLATYPGFSLVEATPETGRTHQIRVHLAALGHPVAGDTTYGPPQRPLGLHRQFLHAAALSFTAPSGQTIRLESPLPPDLATVLKKLENQV